MFELFSLHCFVVDLQMFLLSLTLTLFKGSFRWIINAMFTLRDTISQFCS